MSSIPTQQTITRNDVGVALKTNLWVPSLATCRQWSQLKKKVPIEAEDALYISHFQNDLIRNVEFA